MTEHTGAHVPPTNEDGSRAFIDDPDSGLFSEQFLRAILPTRVATARRSLKQLGLILVSVDTEDGATEPDLAEVGALVARTLRDSDIAARLDDGRFAMLLEFTPVDGCVVVAERFAGKVAGTFPGSAACAGVSCYPAHAIDAAELFATATAALGESVTGGPGTVTVAPVPD